MSWFSAKRDAHQENLDRQITREINERRTVAGFTLEEIAAQIEKIKSPQTNFEFLIIEEAKKRLEINKLAQQIRFLIPNK